jgi:hypothetical protein
MLALASQLAAQAWASDQAHTVYFEPADDSAGPDHPRALLQHSAKKAIAYDQLARKPGQPGTSAPQPTRAKTSAARPADRAPGLPPGTRRSRPDGGSLPQPAHRNRRRRTTRTLPKHHRAHQALHHASTPAQWPAAAATLCLLPITLEATPITPRPEARLRTATENACRVSQSHADRLCARVADDLVSAAAAPITQFRILSAPLKLTGCASVWRLTSMAAMSW